MKEYCNQQFSRQIEPLQAQVTLLVLDKQMRSFEEKTIQARVALLAEQMRSFEEKTSQQAAEHDRVTENVQIVSGSESKVEKEFSAALDVGGNVVPISSVFPSGSEPSWPGYSGSPPTSAVTGPPGAEAQKRPSGASSSWGLAALFGCGAKGPSLWRTHCKADAEPQSEIRFDRMGPGDEVCPGVEEFSFSVHRKPGSSLGLNLSVERAHLVVTQVNRQQSPLCHGDRIVAIGGVRGDGEELLQMIRRTGTFTITCQRSPSTSV